MENCVLCLELVDESELIKVSKSRSPKIEGWNLIKLHFLEVSEDISSHTKSRQHFACQTCWKALKTFHDFYEKIKSRHKNHLEISEVIIKKELEELPKELEELPVKWEFQFVTSNPPPIKQEPEEPDELDEILENAFQALNDDEEPPKQPKKPREKREKLSDESFLQIRLNLNPEDERRIKETADMFCDICSKPLESFSHASFHYRTCHRLKGYLKCCGKKYKKRFLLVEHLNAHYNTGIPCEVCGKKFNSRQQLGRHVMVHEEKKDFQCDHCPKRFATKYKICHHLRNVHAIENRLSMYECTEPGCKRSFVHKSQLKHHLHYSHGEGDKVICEVCSKICKTRNAMDEHMRMHTRQPSDRIKCHICGHYLAGIRVYNRHVKNHATEHLDNICPICGRKSKSLRALQGHIRCIHKMEKTHKCRYCEKLFKTPSKLKDHEIAMHTHEKNFPCDFCEKAFRSLCNMQSHRKRCHPDQYLGPSYTRPAENL